MAILPNGINGPFIGRIGNTVGYLDKYGTNIIRGIGEKTSSKGKEFDNQQQTALVTGLLKPVKEFIKVGFRNAPAEKRWDYYSFATSVNKPGAIKGIYPDQEIDYEKVLFSLGNIPPPKNPAVVLNNSILEFSWTSDMDAEGTEADDQIMLIAYFPESMRALQQLSGARRIEQKQTLRLPVFTKETVIMTYMSFISDDRKKLSNSVFTGQVIWDKL